MKFAFGRKSGIGVRRWRRSDLSAIRSVAWHTWMDAYGGFIPEEDMRSFHEAYYAIPRLLQLYNSGIVDGWVSTVENEVVGYSKSHWNKETQEFYVTSLYVLPQHQGSGLGKALLDKGIEQALKIGTDRLWLGVMSENQPAIDWYHRQGFKFVDHKPFTIGKTTVDDLIGYKLIGLEE